MTRRQWIVPASIAVALVAMAINASAQQAPDAENGRYTFTPSSDGVLRLDTRTGRIASCHNRISGWACYTVPDERAALDTEIGRLQTENTQLKTQLADMRGEQQRISNDLARLKQDYASLQSGGGKAGVAEPKPESPPASSKNKIELQLPDDKDVDRVVSFLERAWRNLIAMADRVHKDVSGKI